jgi:hypothetical protein
MPAKEATMRALMFLHSFVLGALLVLGCSNDVAGPNEIHPGDAPGRQVGSIVIETGADTLWMDETTQLEATVLGVDGDTLTDETVTFTSTSDNILTVSSSGLVTAVGPGAANIIARAGARTATITVFVRIGVIAMMSGDNQKGNLGKELVEPFAVRVTDAQGDGIGMVSLVWSVVSGGGMLEGQNARGDTTTGFFVSTVTDSDGFARVRFTPAALGSTEVMVAVDTYGFQGSPLTFTTIAEPPPFDDLPPFAGRVLIYERAAADDYGLLSRYIIRDDGTFGLEYARNGHYPGFVYPGTYSIRDYLITFDFEGDARWQATARIRGDSMFVEYNEIMYLSDFLDGEFIRSRG